MSQQSVRLELSPEQALVFHDWLARFNGTAGRQFEDQAEERVLWDIEAMLETALVKPFEKDYEAALSAARSSGARSSFS